MFAVFLKNREGESKENINKVRLDQKQGIGVVFFWGGLNEREGVNGEKILRVALNPSYFPFIRRSNRKKNEK